MASTFIRSEPLLIPSLLEIGLDADRDLGSCIPTDCLGNLFEEDPKTWGTGVDVLSIALKLVDQHAYASRVFGICSSGGDIYVNGETRGGGARYVHGGGTGECSSLRSWSRS